MLPPCSRACVPLPVRLPAASPPPPPSFPPTPAQHVPASLQLPLSAATLDRELFLASIVVCCSPLSLLKEEHPRKRHHPSGERRDCDDDGVFDCAVSVAVCVSDGQRLDFGASAVGGC